MKLKDMPVEELELMSYTDMTYMILKENNKSMNTPTIFRKICDLLGYTEDEYVAKIGDYYTSLTIDKRFVLLENNEWDVRDNHSVELVVDDDELEEENSEETEEEETYEDDLDENLDEVIDDDLDSSDMDDLAIVSDDELDEDN